MTAMEEQKKTDIAEVQKFLRAVSKHRGKIPEVIPDGIYGDETREAVSAFQREYGLPVTGSTDGETWDALYAEYKKAADYFGTPRGIYPFIGRDSVISAGDGGYPIYIFQAMMNTLSQFYDNVPGVKINGIYDSRTAAQVKDLQSVMGCEVTGEIDLETWNSLARIYNFHAMQDENEPLELPSEESVG